MLNFEDAIQTIKESWKPLEIGRFNNQVIRLIMAEGEFKIHDHAFDECIIVYKGHINLWTEKGIIDLKEGQGYIATAGTKHNPIAKEKSYLLSIIPAN